MCALHSAGLFCTYTHTHAAGQFRCGLAGPHGCQSVRMRNISRALSAVVRDCSAVRRNSWRRLGFRVARSSWVRATSSSVAAKASIASRACLRNAVGAIRRPGRSGWRVLHRQPVRGGEPLGDPLSGSPVGAAHPGLLPVIRWLRHPQPASPRPWSSSRRVPSGGLAGRPVAAGPCRPAHGQSGPAPPRPPGAGSRIRRAGAPVLRTRLLGIGRESSVDTNSSPWGRFDQRSG